MITNFKYIATIVVIITLYFISFTSAEKVAQETVALKPCEAGIDAKCVQWLISKTLGLAILAFSCLLKAPQIRSMMKAGNANGLTLSALYLDLLSYVCSSTYNALIGAPLTTYAETIIIGIQIIIIIGLCWKYNKTPIQERICVVLAACLYVLIIKSYPTASQPLLISICTIAAMASRVAQIFTNFKTQNTGVLSATSVLMQVAGNIVRVFTTITEVNDIAVLASYIISLVLNATILSQILLIGNKSSQEQPQQQPQQPKAVASSSTADQKQQDTTTTRRKAPKVQ